MLSILAVIVADVVADMVLIMATMSYDERRTTILQDGAENRDIGHRESAVLFSETLIRRMLIDFTFKAILQLW